MNNRIIDKFISGQAVNEEIKAILFYQRYKKWVIDNNLYPLSYKLFCRKIALRFKKEKRQDGFYFILKLET